MVQVIHLEASEALSARAADPWELSRGNQKEQPGSRAERKQRREVVRAVDVRPTIDQALSSRAADC